MNMYDTFQTVFMLVCQLDKVDLRIFNLILSRHIHYTLVAWNPININVLLVKNVYLLKKLRENLGKLYSSALVKEILLSTSAIYISALEINICIDNFYVKYCLVLGSGA